MRSEGGRGAEALARGGHVFVVTEQDAHVELDSFEWLCPHALSSFGREHVEVTVDVPAMDWGHT